MSPEIKDLVQDMAVVFAILIGGLIVTVLWAAWHIGSKLDRLNWILRERKKTP